MDKTPAIFHSTEIFDRNIASLKAILHLVRIHSAAPQFARLDLGALDPDLREMVVATHRSIRYRLRSDFSPMYDNDVATLLAISGVEVFSRERLKLEINTAIKNLQAKKLREII